jgi:hypothetical protein
MSDDFLNEYGLSSEPIDQFVARNRFPAEQKVKYPQNLTTGQEVNRCPDIPFLPIDDWLDTEDWPKMLEEAQRLSKHYVPHRNHENHQGWSSLCVHGLSSVHTESSHTYGFKDADAPWRWTDIADWCPTIAEFFKNKFDYSKYFRIRIMKLAPGGYIVPHRDSIVQEENHIGPINVALNNPEGAEFYMDGHGYLPWVQGRAIKLNLYNVHSVFNHSKEDRYHIIVHGHMGNGWTNRILNNYNNWKKVYA